MEKSHPLSMMEKLPQEIKDAAARLAELNEKRLMKNREEIRSRLLYAALNNHKDPMGAMSQELNDMRYFHQRWLADVREEREKRRTP